MTLGRDEIAALKRAEQTARLHLDTPRANELKSIVERDTHQRAWYETEVRKVLDKVPRGKREARQLLDGRSATRHDDLTSRVRHWTFLLEKMGFLAAEDGAELRKTMVLPPFVDDLSHMAHIEQLKAMRDAILDEVGGANRREALAEYNKLFDLPLSESKLRDWVGRLVQQKLLVASWLPGRNLFARAWAKMKAAHSNKMMPDNLENK